MKRTATNDWKRIRSIFDDALRHPAEDRAEFLRSACGDDEALRLEVESLLESLDSAELFLETPAVIQVIEGSLADEQRLSTGEMLLHYEIGDLLGSGGMGEVYLARDTRLNRNVAIKVLRASFLPDAHASRRLLREARAAALLEHPNICPVYEIAEAGGHNFIVMQYVVGTTLADVLASEKGISTADSLAVATQIAEGLAEAHSQGIIHRDIKPANVMLNDKGQVKILDFGLAKFIEADSDAETSVRLNSSGAVMGTVPFMSPEQLRGGFVDARSDVFSVGALLYEMLAGRPAFNRDNNAETISSILNDDPDLSAIPKALRSTVGKCLAKSVTERYASVDDLLGDLRRLRNTGVIDDAAAPATTATEHRTTGDPVAGKKRQFHFWQSGDQEESSHARGIASAVVDVRTVGWLWKPVAGTVALFATIAVAFFAWQATRTSARRANLDSLRSVQLASWKAGAVSKSTDYRVSHDGKMVAYSSSQSGGNDVIYIKQTSDSEEFPVTKDSWTNVSPLWSPDDQKIAFVSIRDNKTGIYLSPVLSGVVTPLMITDRTTILLRHWGQDGRTIYYEQAGNLYALEIETGSTVKVTHLPDAAGVERYFSFSPDEQQIVFSDMSDGRTDLWKLSVNGGKPIRLTNDADKEFRALWHPDGNWILYNVIRGGFSQINLLTLDESQPLLQVTRGEGEYVLVDLSPRGDRIYYAAAEKKSDVFSVDVKSRQEAEIAARSELEFWPAVSPDGRSVAYHVNTLPNPTAKMYESSFVIKSQDEPLRRIAGKGFDARWLPDNRHLSVFRLGELNPPTYEAWIIDTVTGSESRITSEDVFIPPMSVMPVTRASVAVLDFSPDGKRFVYLDMRKPNNAKIGSLDGNEVMQATHNQNPNLRYWSVKFSRDGKRLAIVSLERSADPQTKPTRRLHVVEGESVSDIYSAPGDMLFIGWSHDGEIILASTKQMIDGSSVKAEITSVSVGGRIRSIAMIESVYTRTITLSADGRTIAFATRQDDRDDIWTLPLLSGAEPTQITRNGTTRQFLTNLVFSPDGKTIFYDKQEEINTISMFENFN